jgi:hypothetical protein
METSALVPGRTYYRLTFADPDMTMPGLEPLVYVGLHESEGEILPTFQDTISYTWVGGYPGPFKREQDIEVMLFPMKTEEAAEMLSLAEAVAEINELFGRAERLGFPVLRLPRIPPSDAA